MSKPKTTKVEKTKKLDQRKLTRITRKYGISAMSVRELQLGYVEEFPEHVAQKLIEAGLVKKVNKRKRSDQVRVDSLNTKNSEPIEDTTIDDTDTENIDNENSIVDTVEDEADVDSNDSNQNEEI